MKNASIHKVSLLRKISAYFLLAAVCMPAVCIADTRQEAITAISAIRSGDLVKKMPDEVKSLEATFAAAENYNRANDTANSEQFYRMTIQKARLISTDTTKPSSAASVPPADSNQAKTDIHNSSSSQTPKAKTFAGDSTATNTATPDEPETVQPEVISEKIVGSVSTYTTVKGDTIRLVAAKLGVSRQHLSQMNKLDAKGTFRVGQQLKYNNRKIIPARMQEGILINIPDRTLYFFQEGKLVRSLPVALGTATRTAKYVWQTPIGKFKITSKTKDPTWYVPPSIQAEMKDMGKTVITSIPPGPSNPLGKYAMKTSLPGILIHSTTKPWSIYSFASHGCIRVYPVLMEDFFKEVKVNTQGEIIYQPVKLAVTEDGRVFLEVHVDVYSKSKGLAAEAKKLIETNQLSERINWKKFDSVVKQKQGIAEDITL